MIIGKTLDYMTKFLTFSVENTDVTAELTQHHKRQTTSSHTLDNSTPRMTFKYMTWQKNNKKQTTAYLVHGTYTHTESTKCVDINNDASADSDERFRTLNNIRDEKLQGRIHSQHHASSSRLS